jgi:hypothetical protein
MTKKIVQEDFNTLYTGQEIDSAFVYATFLAFYWAVMCFSAGMPLLYPIAAVFYIIQYWFYKFMAIKHYQRTTSFTE